MAKEAVPRSFGVFGKAGGFEKEKEDEENSGVLALGTVQTPQQQQHRCAPKGIHYHSAEGNEVLLHRATKSLSSLQNKNKNTKNKSCRNVENV